MTKSKYETSVCAFTRSVDPSIGMLTAHADDKDPGTPVQVRIEGFLGQVSPYKPAKGKENNTGSSLPGQQHICRMPEDRGILKISGRVRFISASTQPTMCDNPDFSAAVSRLFDEAKVSTPDDDSVLLKIAGRYVWNLLNGRFAWRNRFSALDQKVRIIVRDRDEVITLVSDPLTYDLSIPTDSVQGLAAGVISAGDDEDHEGAVDRVRTALARALTTPSGAVMIDFFWEGDVGPGATVYPSQAYYEGKTSLGKILLNVGTDDPVKRPGNAIMSDQKIGAALRYFDDWHGQGTVVPVNPYAGDKNTKESHRQKKDIRKVPNPALYSLLLDDDFMGTGEVEYSGKGLPSDIASRNLAFVIANLIRGGLFQTKGAGEGRAPIGGDEEGSDDE